MAQFTLQLDVEGPVRRYRDILNRLKNKKPVFQRAISRLIRLMLQRQFLSEGSAYGTKWAALSPKYARWKANQFGSLGLLQRSGKLFRAFALGGTGSGLRDVIFGSGVEEGLEVRAPGVPHWIWHQLGTARMPQRKLVPDPLPDQFVSDVKRALRNYIMTGETDA